MKKPSRYLMRPTGARPRRATAPRGEARGNPVFDAWSSGRDFLSSAANPGPNVNPKTALTFSAWFAAINVLSTDLACLPLKIYRARKSGGRDEVTDDPRTALLSVSPDGETTAMRWRQAWVGQTLGHGNGVAEIGYSGGDVSGLYLLEPGTEPQRRGQDRRLYYRLNDGSTLPPYKVLHLAGFGPDGLSGYSVARQARQAIALGLSAETFGAAFFANGTRPSGALKHPGQLKGQARQNILDSWREMHSGAGNAGSTVLLEEGMDWQAFSIPPEDAQFLATRQFQVVEVARLFRLPPHKLGDYSQAHLANLAESNQDYYNTTLMPWCVAIENELTCKLLTEDERKAGHYVQHQMNALLRADPKARAEFYTSMFGLAVMTPNTISELEDMNPIGADGDERFLTVQAVPLRSALNPPEPASSPADPPPGASDATPPPSPVPAGDAPAPADAPVSPPGDTPTRARRFNPNHAADGKFGAGGAHGGGLPSGTVRAGGEDIDEGRMQAVSDRVGDLGRQKGQDWRFSAGGPKNDREKAAAAKAEDRDRFLVNARVEPKRSADKAGDTTRHTVGGDLAAETLPHPGGQGWVSREHNPNAPGGHDDYHFATEARAEKNSRAYADHKAKQQTSNSYDTPKDLEGYFGAERENKVFGGDAATHTHSYRLVLPPRGDRSAAPVSHARFSAPPPANGHPAGSNGHAQ
jgi:HK97 family phage portal protein